MSESTKWGGMFSTRPITAFNYELSARSNGFIVPCLLMEFHRDMCVFSVTHTQDIYEIMVTHKRI